MKAWIGGVSALLFVGAACAEPAAIEVAPCPKAASVATPAAATDARDPWRYPAQARRNREHGTVSLKLVLDDQGAARRVSLIKGSGSSTLDRSAAAAAKSTSVRFCPVDGGTPVSSGIAVVHVTYVLTERIAQL
jgi:protein TonB